MEEQHLLLTFAVVSHLPGGESLFVSVNLQMPSFSFCPRVVHFIVGLEEKFSVMSNYIYNGFEIVKTLQLGLTSSKSKLKGIRLRGCIQFNCFITRFCIYCHEDFGKVTF